MKQLVDYALAEQQRALLEEETLQFADQSHIGFVSISVDEILNSNVGIVELIKMHVQHLNKQSN